jgi:hypothetical protein
MVIVAFSVLLLFVSYSSSAGSVQQMLRSAALLSDSSSASTATAGAAAAADQEVTTAAAPPQQETKRSITEIFIEQKTDKHWRHYYDRYYEGWFAPFRSKKDLMMAEIGAEQGYSLKSWAEYFDHPKRIIGVAYGESAAGVERVEGHAGVELSILRGDQSKKETMDQLCSMGPFDIIIDDGSHVPKHMIFSFFSLFKNCLNPGGLFVIEDLETNYWNVEWPSFGYKMEGTGFVTSPADNAVEKMKQFIDILARYQLHSPELSIMDGDEAICSIEFGMNILVVKKCTEEAMRNRPGHLPKSRVDVETRDKFVAEAKRTNPSME